ncbi:protease 2 [Hibiscus syriacus]|uniref:protease 2 n=1 Tax=Hibiscus syriacus TaxID=106335 RepID=UPI0019222D8A|nr:protease 2 [Hibiscus syriacus]
MYLFSRLISHASPRRHSFSLSFTLIPHFFSSFSSVCRAEPIFVPSQIPPVPKSVPFTVSLHGHSLQDPYHWMHNTSDPDFLNYLNQENSYAQAFMADTQYLQRTLVAEMKNWMPPKVSTPVERFGPWLYYEYIPEGKEYPVLCRRFNTEKRGWADRFLRIAKAGVRREEILLDWNKVAEKYGYVHVGQCRISPDHNFLAYTLDATGSEQFMLQVKDLRNGCIIPRAPVDGVVSLAWAQDCQTLFYTIADENQRPYRVLCTKLGVGNTDDTLVFTENDSSYCVDLTSTKDGKFITVNSNSRSSSEVYVIDSTDPLNDLQKVHNRIPGIQYFLEHHFGFFYILTNAPMKENMKCSNEGLCLARCQVGAIQSTTWQNIFFPGEDTSLQDMDIFNGHLVLSVNKNGFPMICSIDLPINVDCKPQMQIEDLDPWIFPIPSNSCSIEPCSNLDFMNSVYRVVLSSPVIPDIIVDYDMKRRTFLIVQQEEVRCAPGNAKLYSSGYALQHHGIEKVETDQNVELQIWKDFSDTYCCERKEVISHDGVLVPLTILYSQKAWKCGQSPGILHGYGAYGEVLDKSWRVDRLSLLDRGWVMAFADVRGGAGDDPSWHKSGNGLLKQNSIHDFVSCGKYLIDEGYVQRDQMSAIGVSAGCLLIGAALNMLPNLFRAAILKVPFLDILNSLLDPSLPLTVLDYEEFGNPQIKAQFECILSYSPYENIRRGGCHPSVLVTASFNDSRVGVWEAAKWVAKVRDGTCALCSRSVILKTNMTGGHFGEGGRYRQCEETAYDYAFLVKVMGINMN